MFYLIDANARGPRLTIGAVRAMDEHANGDEFKFDVAAETGGARKGVSRFE
jgi:hypothetical protein